MLAQPVPDAHLSRGDLAIAVEHGNIPTLLMVLFQLTGDQRWLRAPYAPTRARGLDDHDTGGLTPALQAEIRAAATDAIRAWHAGTPAAVETPDPDLLVKMMSVYTGEAVPAEYAPMTASEMGFGAPAPSRIDASLLPDGFSVVIIGAGVSGLIAGYQMSRLGVPFTILEKNQEVGGTWLENRYPGAGVDTPSHLYSFSFLPRNWSSYYGKRDEVAAYITGMADHFDLKRHIRFGVEATSAHYDDAGCWTVRYDATDGTPGEIKANVLITAVGLHNRPKIPALPGMSSFEGPIFHTARWPEDLDLDRKDVAVVGTGASAMQVVPAIAERVGRLTVFQRSPQWITPASNYFAPIGDRVQSLFERAPYYRQWYRFRLAWAFNDKNHGAYQKDPSWPHPERSLNAINDRHRESFTQYIRNELAGRPDLLAKSLPTYPPFGKRILLDNGWYRAIQRDNVELVTDALVEVTTSGIRAATGEDYDADVIVLSTGFQQQRFLYPMEITGREGRSLRDEWDDDDARSYLGITMPGFPNMFMTYGPNTNPGGGSTIFTLEAQMHYITELLAQMVRRGATTIECRIEPYTAYNAEVDAAHEAMIWTHPGMDTYYRNSKGRVVTNTPWRVVDYWHRTHRVDLNDYDLGCGSTVGARTADDFVRAGIDASSR
ncbi:flavin-containing monooxygenase [Streptomyces sp. NPDC101455]|uniref:flavin-containing monooxygenase n=1 Tax=Streptomyces sp. NPDC101455 TaxID=3366142 RepID=UPI00380CCF32